jgi:hypothetical protein
MTMSTITALPPHPAIKLEAAGQSSFLYRVIRLLAFVLSSYALLHLVQYALFFVIQGTSWRYGRGPFRWIERATTLSTLGALVLLLAGAVGMLKGKHWSRPAVMWWAVLHVVIGLVSSAAWIVRYANDQAAVRATTQVAYGQPVWQMMLWQMMWSISNAFFPLLVWLILRQPDAANYFSRVRGGGFEVVPFANAIAREAAAPPPGPGDASTAMNG